MPENEYPDITPPEGEAEALANDELALLKAERDELQGKLLRLTADYQNMARRSRSESSEARQQQLLEMARALVPVLDHFELALSVDPSKTAADSLAQGVKMVYDELIKTLGKFDIKRLEAKPGEEFDPQKHEAVMHQKADGIPQGHVALQLQAGYVLGDKTIRPAKVAIAD